MSLFCYLFSCLRLVAFLFVSLFRSCSCHVCVLVVVLVSSVFQTLCHKKKIVWVLFQVKKKKVAEILKKKREEKKKEKKEKVGV